jgi:hypothetical protein
MERDVDRVASRAVEDLLELGVLSADRELDARFRRGGFVNMDHSGGALGVV